MWLLFICSVLLSVVLSAQAVNVTSGYRNVSKNNSYEDILNEVLGRKINPLVPPSAVGMNDHLIPVDVDFYLHRIISLNSYSATLKVSGKLRVAWMDKRYAWNNGPDALFITPNVIWCPELTLLTSSDFEPVPGRRILILRSGHVVMERTVSVGVACNINMRLFPRDLQICDLVFAPILAQRHLVSPTSAEGECQIDQVMSEEWSLTSCRRAKRSVKLHNSFGQLVPEPTISVTLTLSRNSAFYVLTIIIPTTMLAIVTLIPFLLPPSLSAQKIIIPITAYLSFNIYMILMEKSLPKSRDTPVLGQAVAVFMFVCVFTEICQAVSVKFYSCRLQVIPRVLAFIYFRVFAVITCFRTCHGTSYMQNYEDGVSGISLDSKNVIQKAWLSMGRINDRIGLLISLVIVASAMLYLFITCF